MSDTTATETDGRVEQRRLRWRKPPRLYEEVGRDLAEAIVRGSYAAGEFLPSEQELARDYGASRNVVREAIRLLSARGLVEILHGRGIRVLPRHRWQFLDRLIDLVREDRRVPQNLLELRRILEVEVAGLAAERATAEQVAAIEAALHRMVETADRPEECIEHDILFHRLLAEATGNDLLPTALEPVGQLLRASRLATIRNPGIIDMSISAHRAILDRVVAGDAAGARAAMRDHLLQVERGIHRLHQGEIGA
jgi:GntR family transcriptional repressor for pyruvate dehydrogenase complex